LSKKSFAIIFKSVLLSIPATLPDSEYCQIAHESHPIGSFGGLTVGSDFQIRTTKFKQNFEFQFLPVYVCIHPNRRMHYPQI